MTLDEYREKLARERTWLDGQIAKLPRSNPIRAELQEALSLSHDAEAALSDGDAVGAAQARDLMHLTLHHAKLFQWQPLMKGGATFSKNSNVGRANLAKGTQALKQTADDNAVAKFNAWCESPSQRNALAKLPVAERLKRYVRISKPRGPPERVKRRLKDMLKAGSLK